MQKLLQESIRFYEQWQKATPLGEAYVRPLITELKLLKTAKKIRPFMPPVVEQWLGHTLEMTTHPSCQSLIEVLKELATELKWVPSPENYISPEFAKGFAYTQLVGHAHRKVESALYESNKVALGFSIQAPGYFYPPHYHKAVEFYTPLTGTAVWQLGANEPKPQPPGAHIFHDSDVPHAMETTEEPLLTIWAWIGDLKSPTVVPQREWL